jgi:hypothetical protein
MVNPSLKDVWQDAGNDFWKEMRPGEKIGMIKLNQSDLRFWPRVLDYENFLINYFQTGFFRSVDDIQKFLKLKMDNPVYNQYQEEVEGYVKAVWLAGDFIKEGGLRKPLGVHWSELEKKWFIHPGGTRQAIIKLFGPEYIECIGFNTNGKKASFFKVFNSIEDIAKYTNSTKVYIAATRNWDTNIPHIHMDGFTIKPAILEKVRYLHKFFRTTKIQANFNLKDWGYNEDKVLRKVKRRVTVNVDNLTNDNIMKALLLLPTFNGLDLDGVHIERT